MARVQLALNVSDLDAGGRLLLEAVRTPSRRRCGPATRTSRSTEPPLKLVLIEGHGDAGHAEPPRGRGCVDRRGRVPTQDRLRGDGLATATEDEVACCYAVQDKVWVDGPDRRAVGDLHGARPTSRWHPANCVRLRRPTTRRCCAAAPESAARCC